MDKKIYKEKDGYYIDISVNEKLLVRFIRITNDSIKLHINASLTDLSFISVIDNIIKLSSDKPTENMMIYNGEKYYYDSSIFNPFSDGSPLTFMLYTPYHKSGINIYEERYTDKGQKNNLTVCGFESYLFRKYFVIVKDYGKAFIKLSETERKNISKKITKQQNDLIEVSVCEISGNCIILVDGNIVYSKSMKELFL